MRPINMDYIDRILRCIDEHRDRTGVSPTYTEMTAATGISRSSIYQYIKYMEKQGMLEYVGSRQITTTHAKKLSDSTPLPLVGKIACGDPNFAEENIETYIHVPVSMLGSGKHFILRASGDSMIKAGIDSGDLVIIRQQPTAYPGQIVAIYDADKDSTTLKRFYPEPENRRVRLHPENDALDDFYMTNFIIQGVAVKVLKVMDLK